MGDPSFNILVLNLWVNLFLAHFIPKGRWPADMYGVHQFLKKEGQKKYKDAKAEVNHKMPPGGPLS